MKIVGDALAERVAQWLSEEYYPVRDRVFPDGELCPRFEYSGQTLDGEAGALILQRGAGEDINAYLMKYCLLLGAMKDSGFSKIIAVMPYMAYARQHKQYLPGQPVSALAVARMLEFCGIDRFVTVNAHEPSEMAKLFTVPTIHLSATGLLAEHMAKRKEYADAVVIAPDDGAEAMALQVAKVLGGRQCIVFEKKRDIATGDITLTPRNGEMLKGRSVIVVDDMVSSGATMVEAVRACSHLGATRTAAVFVHPVLSDNALEKLRACCDDIVATNSIASEVSSTDVSPVIAQALREIGKKL